MNLKTNESAILLEYAEDSTEKEIGGETLLVCVKIKLEQLNRSDFDFSSHWCTVLSRY